MNLNGKYPYIKNGVPHKWDTVFASFCQSFKIGESPFSMNEYTR